MEPLRFSSSGGQLKALVTQAEMKHWNPQRSPDAGYALPVGWEFAGAGRIERPVLDLGALGCWSTRLAG